MLKLQSIFYRKFLSIAYEVMRHATNTVCLQFRRENKRKKGEAPELHYFPFFGYKEKIERNEEIYLWYLLLIAVYFLFKSHLV